MPTTVVRHPGDAWSRLSGSDDGTGRPNLQYGNREPGGRTRPVKEDVMISWNECDARFASHEERIARVDLAGQSVSFPVLGRRRRGVVATTAAILAWVPARTGTSLTVVGQWLIGDKPVAEVG